MEIKILTEGNDFASRITQMFENVIHQGHGSLALIFLIGIILVVSSNIPEWTSLKRSQVFPCSKTPLFPKCSFLR